MKKALTKDSESAPSLFLNTEEDSYNIEDGLSQIDQKINHLTDWVDSLFSE